MTEPSTTWQSPWTPGESACEVRAFAVVSVAFEDLAALRKAPGPRPPGVDKIAHSLLKHADHQTLLAMAAVLRASHDFGLPGPFRDWGIIAAPRFLGRVGIAGPLFRFSRSGASAVSPLIIPTMSLHAVAGSLSMAIKARGFHFGVGGGPGHLAEALTAGLASLDETGAPGVWVVATGFDPEPRPDVSGDVLNESTGHAVALALSASSEKSRSALRLQLRPGPTPPGPPGPTSDADGGEPLTDLLALSEFLNASTGSQGSRAWRCVVPGLGLIDLVDDRAVSVSRRAG
ncbi:MAG: hypothetical protein AB7I30_08345 [Isosphaeraceae bacterium]